MKTANFSVKSSLINALKMPDDPKVAPLRGNRASSARHLRRNKPELLTLALATALTLGMSAEAFAKCGDFSFIAGDVNLQIGGVGAPVPVKVGMSVAAKDVIITGKDGMAQLVMVDKARLSLRFNSRLTVEKCDSDKGDADGTILSLFRGTLRTFTGLLSDSSRSKYQMKTRVATVGIRGSGNLLVQPDDGTIMYNYTIEGAHVTTENVTGRTIVSYPDQTVFARAGQAPVIIPTTAEIRNAAFNMVGTGGTGGTGDIGDTPPPPGGDVGNGPPPSQIIFSGNGVGFSIVDNTVPIATTDQIGLRDVVIANGTLAYGNQALTTDLTQDAGNLRGYRAYAGTQSGVQVGISGGTAADALIVNVGNTNIAMGRWANTTGLSLFGPSTSGAAPGSVHWIHASSGYPSYLSEVLTGTVQYTRVANTTPTNQLGTLGSFVSAVLDVNFTSRTLNATIAVTMPNAGTNTGGAWNLAATNVPFSLNSFAASTGGQGLVISNGAGQSSASNANIFGSLTGSLVGATLNAAILGYGFTDRSSPTSNNTVNGVIAFQGPPQNSAAQFRDGVVSDPTGALNGATYIRSFNTTNRPNEVTSDDTGRVTAFTAPFTQGNQLQGHLPYAVGTATIVDNGFDPTTGMVWGRWAGGTVTIGGQSVALGNKSMHYIFSGTQSGPVTLPLTGSANYAVIGSTKPTDNLGNVGTLNSASLNANFSARTVDTALNLTIAGQTWNASAAGVPIYRDQYFSAYAGSSGIAGAPAPSLLNITCSPSCTPQRLSGSIDGFFTGRTGQSAGLMYNLNSSIAGSIAFRRPG